MLRRLDCRAGHYALLVLTWALICLPALGGPSLWDIDEGNNAEAAQEMRASGNWVVPTFNFELRDDKPALLYWLQWLAYSLCGGPCEFGARLPSALAALVVVLGVYELGRSMFGAAAGLLAGVILASSALFVAAAHFANPDALLTTCTLLALLAFWRDLPHGGRSWFIWSSLACGLGVLAKGPVGVILPCAVTGLVLLWERRLQRLLDTRLLTGVLVFLATAAPWYAWVAVETKGKWLVGFWFKHNLIRYTATMENHAGLPGVYYLLVLLIGLAPWSVFLGPTIWHLWSRRARLAEEATEVLRERSALRLLLCWVGVYLVFFSLSQTRLPNYILPLYPAAAVLLARSLDRWRRGLWQPSRGLLLASLACLALVGVGLVGGLAVAGGLVPLPLRKWRPLPGLEQGALLGLVPLITAIVAYELLRTERRGALLSVVGVGAVLFTASLAVWAPCALDRFKAPRVLAGALPSDQTRHDVRIASYDWFQPSLVFYCQRQVRTFEAVERDKALQFLDGPLPSYLFLPARRWEELRLRAGAQCYELARHRDLYTGHEIVVVGNGRYVPPEEIAE
jgi:4-amino-4-deoxy-L-arabinose transferase-like glycosyltransferase